ncbi:ATP-binding protein [Pararhizobium haloflavum]|uniref:ATP-binding protein n=1 Tax=Pararhizobium haloflavum TaxID=2037914 RepID=UPI000C1A880A|nr:YhaN family protein [Pararhizobium haloflavum]
MRFSRLSLERYGRFEDCELNFRPGTPDLHVIYGENEAGKTTSLAAVSDLLFGFPVRSPYNFLFDYSLLRVGAVLEDGGTTFACRRKKGTSGTLLGVDDIPIDEAPLAAMLRGQTRDTFGLSFSLDQEVLRSGGKAMVEAKNDVGRTLFAAGSGLTGLSDELRRLEAEADAIWGPTNRGSRTFTVAQRQLAESTRLVRDDALKPKAWSDARAATERTREALEAARRDRDAVQAESRAAERVRRLAPLVRRREEQTMALVGYDGVVDLGRQRETAAEELVREAEEAVRAISAAEGLRADIADRRAAVSTDPQVVGVADQIDRLVADAGAEVKAKRDLVGLEAEHADAAATVRRLRAEAGRNADATPQRELAARLRELARVDSEQRLAMRQVEDDRRRVEDRRGRAAAALGATIISDAVDALTSAVDHARALGADVDARCDALRAKLDGATRRADDALARLAPWTGDGDALACLARVDDSEVHEARDALAALVAEVRREEEAAQRASDQSAAAALEISQSATGTAVSSEDMAEVRTERDRLWRPLREHLLNGAALPAPAEAIAGYESSVAAADDRADARFASADASGRLSLLEQTRASHGLAECQAVARAQSARTRHEEVLAGWMRRLADVCLPTLEPGRFYSWQANRDVAEAAQAEVRNLIADVELSGARRDAARVAMSAALGVADGGGPIAPVLAKAERRRAEFEDVARKRLLAQAELDQLHVETAALDYRQRAAEDALDANGDAWRAALTEAGLDIDVLACSAVLDLLDELREATAYEASLRRRIEGIGRDTREHAAAVGQLADAIGVPAGEVQERLRSLRDRLAAARSAETLNGSLDDEDKRRHGELQEAQAKLKATEEVLATLLAKTCSADRVALGAAIERSRAKRGLVDEVAATERTILEAGDGLRLDDLLEAVGEADPDHVAAQLESLGSRLEELNAAVDEAATAHGDARATFAALDTDRTSAVDAAADAEQARSELEVLAEDYILKRAQAVTLKWAIEKYRERHQDPLLLRAGELFSTLTTGRYTTLKVDTDAPSPRLLGMRDDMRTMVEVDAMSEGTTDQLFLALRLAALEQSVAAGVGLPFLADDLFVNFDDRRAEAGFRVLAEVARTTQVLFFTHHPHLVQIAKSVVGAELHSECALL